MQNTPNWTSSVPIYPFTSLSGNAETNDRCGLSYYRKGGPLLRAIAVGSAFFLLCSCADMFGTQPSGQTPKEWEPSSFDGNPTTVTTPLATNVPPRLEGCVVDLSGVTASKKQFLVLFGGCIVSAKPVSTITETSQAERVSNFYLIQSPDFNKEFEKYLSQQGFVAQVSRSWLVRLGSPIKNIVVSCVYPDAEDEPVQLVAFSISNDGIPTRLAFDANIEVVPREDNRSLVPVLALGTDELLFAFIADTAQGSGLGGNDLFLYRLLNNQVKLVYRGQIDYNETYSYDPERSINSTSSFEFVSVSREGKSIPSVLSRTVTIDDGIRTDASNQYFWNGDTFMRESER